MISWSAYKSAPWCEYHQNAAWPKVNFDRSNRLIMVFLLHRRRCKVRFPTPLDLREGWALSPIEAAHIPLSTHRVSPFSRPMRLLSDFFSTFFFLFLPSGSGSLVFLVVACCGPAGCEISGRDARQRSCFGPPLGGARRLCGCPAAHSMLLSFSFSFVGFLRLLRDPLCLPCSPFYLPSSSASQRWQVGHARTGL